MFLVVYGVTCLATPFIKALRLRSIENQITFLSKLLEDGYDDVLQQRFPEGKMFSNALLGLSTIEYANHNEMYSKRYASLVDTCILRMLSKEARNGFDISMNPQYGMFYNGWTLLVINTYSQSPLSKYTEITEVLSSKSKEIEQRLQDAQEDSIHVLDTYSGSNWPADNLIGLVSLKNKYLQKDWLNTILKTTKDQEELIHHAGLNRHKARGSSSAMITYCLSKIAPAFAKEYNSIYRARFVDSFLRVDLVLEHTDGSNIMDVDSGPVIFGYGASATVMNIKTQASLGRINGRNSWAMMNLIGLPINLFGQKYYLLKQEPMLDLFLLWGAVEL